MNVRKFKSPFQELWFSAQHWSNMVPLRKARGILLVLDGAPEPFRCLHKISKRCYRLLNEKGAEKHLRSEASLF